MGSGFNVGGAGDVAGCGGPRWHPGRCLRRWWPRWGPWPGWVAKRTGTGSGKEDDRLGSVVGEDGADDDNHDNVSDYYLVGVSNDDLGDVSNDDLGSISTDDLAVAMEACLEEGRVIIVSLPQQLQFAQPFPCELSWQRVDGR